MFGGAARKAGAVPACVFCHPEVAGVGMTEAEARASGRAVRTGKFPFSASGRAVASGETEGFVKLICEAGSGRLLGARLIGAGVAELAGELSLALELGATVSDLARTMHAHPTLAEALMEAAETLAEAARA
ncbi:MAG: hypothetical protein LBR12_00235 [Opitutaceae bacterium]|nr:hypothetical protein [Opitutaceae bacterium]